MISRSLILFWLLQITAFCAPVTFNWNAPTNALTSVTGYYLHVGNLTFQSKSNKITADIPPGSWNAYVTAYSTNNSSSIPLESQPSNPVFLFVPPPPSSNQVSIPYTPFIPPVISFSSNPVARITGYLQVNTDLTRTNWGTAVPLWQYDVNDGTDAVYRTVLNIQRVP